MWSSIYHVTWLEWINLILSSTVGSSKTQQITIRGLQLNTTNHDIMRSIGLIHWKTLPMWYYKAVSQPVDCHWRCLLRPLSCKITPTVAARRIVSIGYFTNHLLRVCIHTHGTSAKALIFYWSLTGASRQMHHSMVKWHYLSWRESAIEPTRGDADGTRWCVCRYDAETI